MAIRINKFMTVTIPASGTESGIIDTADYAIAKIRMPDALTTSTEITFKDLQEEEDKGGVWGECVDAAGDPLAVTFTADSSVRIPDACLPALGLRLVVADIQTSDRVFGVRLFA